MPVATAEFRHLLGRLSHNVGQQTGRLLSRMSHLSAHDARMFISDAWPELLRPFLDAAADLTTQWYDEQFSTNTVFVPQPADPPPDEQLGASGRWGVGQDDPQDALTGSGERAVFNASRKTVLDNVIREDGARWAREARPGACSFCKLMTTRGAVFWTEASALTVVGRTPHSRLLVAGAGVGGQLRDTRDYGESYHDNCRCIAVAVRPGDTYTPPEYAQSWDSDYIDAYDGARKQLANKGEHRAVTLDDITNAWDRLGRERIGAKRGRPRKQPETQ